MNKVLEIMAILNEIEYGFKDENNINLIDTDKWDVFYSFYYLLTPEEVLSKKCGVCWDQVELERKLFSDNSIECETYFIYLDDKRQLPSHTFLTFELNNKYYWFEHAWGNMQGIHEYKNILELLSDVKDKFIKDHEEEKDFDVVLYKYNQPNYHISCDEFYEHIKTQLKIDI